MKALLVGTILCAILAVSHENGVPSDAASRVKIHRSLDRLLVERAGPVHVWVFFEDKGPTDIARALRGLEQTYDPRAIQRRRPVWAVGV